MADKEEWIVDGYQFGSAKDATQAKAELLKIQKRSLPVSIRMRVDLPAPFLPNSARTSPLFTGAWDGVLTVHGAALYLGYAGEAGEDAPARGVPQSPLHIIFFIELPVNVSVFAILTR